MKYFVKASHPKIKSQYDPFKCCYNCNRKGHLSNECFIFWKPNEDRHIPILTKVNASGISRGINFSGSKQIWIPKRN